MFLSAYPTDLVCLQSAVFMRLLCLFQELNLNPAVTPSAPGTIQESVRLNSYSALVFALLYVESEHY